MPLRFGLVVAFLSSIPARADDPIRSRVEAALKAWDVPGAIVVVIRGDRTLFCDGVGDRKLGKPEPVTSDTVFPLASCTKAVTATLIAKLAEEKLLSWDDPIRKHFPAFHLSDPAADAAVTLRDAMCHRSGVAGNDLLWYRAPWDLDETFRRAAKLPAAGSFRTAYHYSSILPAAAGRAAAMRAGKTWDELVREKITGPLGMKGVVFTTKAIPATAARAGGHTTGQGGRVEPCEWYETVEANPAGSICLTAKDLEKWLLFQLAGGKPLLSTAALDETHTPHTVIPFTGAVTKLNPDTNLMTYALGWVVFDYRGRLAVGHGGQIDGFKSLVTLFPKGGLAVAVLSNRFETRMNQALTNGIVDSLLGFPAKDWDAILGKVVRDEEAERAAARAVAAKARRGDVRPTFPIDRYVGTYHNAAYGSGTVRLQDGRLAWEWSSFRCPVEHWQAEQFRITTGRFADQVVEFRTALQGPVAVRFEGVVFDRQ